jgi:hypothetical protein
MENEKDVFEAEINNEEKEFVDAEVVEDEVTDYRDYDDIDRQFDPNVVLQTIMGAQDQGLKNVVLKLSTLNMVTKVTVVCMLFKFTNIIGVCTLLYGIYCAIYVLLNYDKVKDNEHMIQDVLNKGKQVSIKKTVWKNLGILALCIPLALVSFWYYFVFQVS